MATAKPAAGGIQVFKRGDVVCMRPEHGLNISGVIWTTRDREGVPYIKLRGGKWWKASDFEKPLWAMKQSAFIEHRAEAIRRDLREKGRADLADNFVPGLDERIAHVECVKQAYREGKPVPDEVLEEYWELDKPDLEKLLEA